MYSGINLTVWIYVNKMVLANPFFHFVDELEICKNLRYDRLVGLIKFCTESGRYSVSSQRGPKGRGSGVYKIRDKLY